MNNFLKGTILAGLFLVPLVPFIITGSLLFPFITGKAFAFRIIVEIVFVSWIVLALRDPNYRPRFSWILGALAIFVSVITLADIFGENPFKSFWSNFERMEGLITLLHLFAYFLVLSGTLLKEDLWKWFLWTNVGASVLMGFYGLLQLGGKIVINQGGVRLDGTLGNAAYLAVYMMMNIFFVIFLYVRAQDRKKALSWFVPILLLQTVILYQTATRGAMLGLLGGLLVSTALLAWRERENKIVRKTAILALFGVLAIIGGFYLVRNTDFVKESPVLARFNLSPAEIKTQGRYYIWPMAWQGIKEKPILGWGQENFNYVFNKYYNPKLYAQEQWFDRAHSTPLDWFIAGGFLGFASYISIFIFALWYLWKRDEDMSFAEKSVLTGILSAYFFQNIFVFDNLVSYILFFTIIAYIHFRSANKEPMFKNVSLGVHGTSVVSSILVLLLVGVLYFANVKPIVASKNLLNSLRVLQQEAPAGRTEAIEFFKKALSYRSLGTSETVEQMANSAGLFFVESVPIDIREEYYLLTREALLKQIERTPDDARAYVFMGMFLTRAGLYDEAIEYINKAHELSPGKQVNLFEIAGLYLAKGEADKALPILKKAVDLEPSYHGARLLYAIGALYAGELELLDELIAALPLDTLVSDSRLIEALVETEQYERLIPIFVARIEEDPSQGDRYLSLAALLLRMGERERSIEILQALKERLPEYGDEADYYIAEIRAGRNP